MSSANSFRRIMAIPLYAFDSVRAGLQANPKPGNYMFMMTSFVVILMVGNGADKLTTKWGSVANSYETYRRVNRYFIPYFIADYRYKFPQIKQ